MFAGPHWPYSTYTPPTLDEFGARVAARLQQLLAPLHAEVTRDDVFAMYKSACAVHNVSDQTIAEAVETGAQTLYGNFRMRVTLEERRQLKARHTPHALTDRRQAQGDAPTVSRYSQSDRARTTEMRRDLPQNAAYAEYVAQQTG